MSSPPRGRHASPSRRLKDQLRDLERLRAVEGLRREGYPLRPSRSRPSCFEVAAETLPEELTGAPSTIEKSYRRARRLLRDGVFGLLGGDASYGEAYSELMRDEDRDQNGTVILTVRVRPSELEALRRVALAEERSMSATMRLALRRVINEHRGEVPELRA